MKINHCELLSDKGDTIGQLNNYLKEIYTDDTMEEFHYYDNTSSSELYMYYCGISACLPGHTWGPAIRDHYVIHYILKGKGTFMTRNKTYDLTENQGFLISPGEVCTYAACKEDPWEYVWVGFHGLNAANYLKLAELTLNSPFFEFTLGNQMRNCMLDMVIAKNAYAHSTNIRVQSLLYGLFAELVENAKHERPIISSNTKSEYIKVAVEYIQTNYMNRFTIADLSDHVGLDRSYFSTIFKECLGLSPQKYLTQFRINKACTLLINEKFSIGEIATITGYSDPVIFQKAFRNTIGISPSKFRRSNKTNQT